VAEAGEATARAVEGLLAVARGLGGGDPLRDEPASVFRPLDPAEPAGVAEPRDPRTGGR
jgi:hypothetical protein